MVRRNCDRVRRRIDKMEPVAERLWFLFKKPEFKIGRIDFYKKNWNLI